MAVTHKKTNLNGQLEFHVYYEVDGTDPRDHPYRSPHKNSRYIPDTVHLELRSSSLDPGKPPRYKDLQVTGVRVTGFVVKQDGTPGKQACTETFYTFDRRPDWLARIIEEATREVRNLGVVKYEMRDS